MEKFAPAAVGVLLVGRSFTCSPLLAGRSFASAAVRVLLYGGEVLPAVLFLCWEVCSGRCWSSSAAWRSLLVLFWRSSSCCGIRSGFWISLGSFTSTAGEVLPLTAAEVLFFTVRKFSSCRKFASAGEVLPLAED